MSWIKWILAHGAENPTRRQVGSGSLSCGNQKIGQPGTRIHPASRHAQSDVSRVNVPSSDPNLKWFGEERAYPKLKPLANHR
jgi:hypothetical protein